jgi:hypothetical protein
MEPGRIPREAPDGIEPSDGGFADLCLTTWLRRRRKGKVASRYGFCKSCPLKMTLRTVSGGENGGSIMGRCQTQSFLLLCSKRRECNSRKPTPC